MKNYEATRRVLGKITDFIPITAKNEEEALIKAYKLLGDPNYAPLVIEIEIMEI